MRLTTRGVVTEALTERGSVVAGSVVDNLGGGGSVTWTAGSAIACRIDSLGNDPDDIVASKVEERSTHKVTLPALTQISVDNKFAIDGRGTFEVTAVREHTDEFSRVIEVIAT